MARGGACPCARSPSSSGVGTAPPGGSGPHSTPRAPPLSIFYPHLAQVGLRGPADPQTREPEDSRRERPGGRRGWGGDGCSLRSRSRCGGDERAGQGRSAGWGAALACVRPGAWKPEPRVSWARALWERGLSGEPGAVVTPEGAGSQGDKKDRSWRGIRQRPGRYGGGVEKRRHTWR